MCSPEASATEAPAKTGFFKQDRKPIQQLHKQPGRRTVEESGGQKKANAKQ